jgi:Smg protein
MFEVLVFVYENYDTREACPEPEHLERKLSAVGFDSEEIGDAMVWLQGLNTAAHPPAVHPWLCQPSPNSMRIYPPSEYKHLGQECIGFIRFLESCGVLPPHMREVVIDRAMAVPAEPVGLDDLKIIILMVYWSFGEEPDALVLDELCEDPGNRLAH